MFNKELGNQLQHYKVDREHEEVRSLLPEIIKDAGEVLEEIKNMGKELADLNDLRETLSDREYISYLEERHGKPMDQEISESLQKITDRLKELTEREQEIGQMLRDYHELLVKTRARLREIEIGKDQFYSELLEILNEKKLPKKDLV